MLRSGLSIFYRPHYLHLSVTKVFVLGAKNLFAYSREVHLHSSTRDTASGAVRAAVINTRVVHKL